MPLLGSWCCKLRFSLRTALVVTTVLCAVLAWLGYRVSALHTKVNALARLRSLGASIQLDDIKGARLPDNWLFGFLGDDACRDVKWVSLDYNANADLCLRELPALGSIHIVTLHAANVSSRGLAHLQNVKFADGNVCLAGTSVCDGDLARLHDIDRLHTLDLSWTQVSDAGLFSLSTLSDLEELDLSGVNVEGWGLAHLSRLTRLKCLRLEETSIEGKWLVALSHIEELSLAGALIDDDDVRSLCQLKRLRTLNLDRTSVSDRGLRYLCESSTLTSISLERTQVTSEGTRFLRNIRELAEVSLRGCRIDDSAMPYLVAVVNLKTLLLYETNVSDGAISDFQRVRPETTLFWRIGK